MDINDILGLLILGYLIFSALPMKKKRKKEEKKSSSNILDKLREAIQESLRTEVEENQRPTKMPEAEDGFWQTVDDARGDANPRMEGPMAMEADSMDSMEPAPEPFPREPEAAIYTDASPSPRKRPVSHTRLQRAVVWAEILDRPLALRGKDGGRS